MNKIEHVNATTIDEAVEALGNDAAIIAGGTDILCGLKGMIYSSPPSKLVNIKNIPDLDYIEESGGVLRIGALTTLTAIHESDVVQSKYASLGQAARKVGSAQLRNMGTIAGNICQQTRCWYYRGEHNDFDCLRKGGALCHLVPGNNRKHSVIFGGTSGCFAACPSDVAIPLVALGGTVVTNQREIAAEDFFEEIGNALDDNEVVTEIQIPEPASGTQQVYLKWAWRKAIDFPEVSVATAITVDGGSVTDAKIVLGGVMPRPRRATGAEDALIGNSINEANAQAAGEAAVQGANPLPHNGYKVQLTKVMVKRAILA